MGGTVEPTLCVIDNRTQKDPFNDIFETTPNLQKCHSIGVSPLYFDLMHMRPRDLTHVGECATLEHWPMILERRLCLSDRLATIYALGCFETCKFTLTFSKNFEHATPAQIDSS